MLQQFFKNTNETKFIKNILENFSLPLYKTVTDTDYIVSGQKYIYNNQIIKCLNSGYIAEKTSPVFSPTHTFLQDTSTIIYTYTKLPDTGRIFYNYSTGLIASKFIRYFTEELVWGTAPYSLVNINYNGNIINGVIDAQFKSYLQQSENGKKYTIIKSIPDDISLVEQSENILTLLKNTIQDISDIENLTTELIIDNNNSLSGILYQFSYYKNNEEKYCLVIAGVEIFTNSYTYSFYNSSQIYIFGDLSEDELNSKYDSFNQGATIDSKEIILNPIIFNTPEIEVAKYTLLDNYAFNKNYIDVSQYKTSRYDYYDSETHKYLGDYLRYISKTKQVNLMPYYNCFNYKIANSFGFDRKTLKVIDKNTGYKIYLTPIKFNTDYTVALEHPLNTPYKFVFYGKFGLIKSVDEDKNIHYLDDSIPNNEVKSKSFTFNKPCILRCNCSDSKLNDYEKYLYLAIQVPTTNTSSFVVLEGDFTKPCAEKVYISMTPEAEDSKYSAQLDNVLFTKPQLLELNDGNIYAYSSRLIEYLTENVIDTNDIHEQDIVGIQNKIYTTSTGMYDLALRYKIFTDINHNSGLNQTDLNGYIDRDTEKYISERYK